MGKRLIASDLDGTLFGPKSVPEPRTVAAVNAAVDAGYVFAAVTGRSHFGGAGRVTEAGAQAHWFIGSNGGQRMNLVSGVLEERLLFTTDELNTIMTGLPATLDGVGFGFEHATGFTFDAGFRAVFPNSFDGGPRQDSAGWAPDDVGKIFASHADLTMAELIELATALVPAGVHVSTSGGAFVEFTPQGGDKALGLGRLCEQIGVEAADVIAFGDNSNDVSMLQWAGRGIAMANATDDARAAADELTLSNTDFGVAVVIESLLS